MKTEHWYKFTKAEINHLLTLIDRNENDGVYYSPKNQYWNRSERIKSKLLQK
jgi:hypothetical protein